MRRNARRPPTIATQTTKRPNRFAFICPSSQKSRVLTPSASAQGIFPWSISANMR